ncbi:MAG: glycosyltransferase [Butyricicoccus sp.]|nr:glycosyltransferase [Butyricicoccus sp.]
MRRRASDMELLQRMNDLLALAICLCFAYRIFYIPVRLLRRDPPHNCTKLHRYAVLIAARNEAAVIGDLLDSIRAQDYPAEQITVFVAADNCTDNTAAIARAHGAVVWERHDRTHIGKGYALHFLLQHIHHVYGDRFDGYFVFDADNLLDPHYITEMNRTFSAGYPILTSYRNSKNYGDNWISAGYSLWFLQESEYLNHARMLLGVSCMVSGTGFLFSRAVLHRHGGWNCFLLTEDIEFSVRNILAGERIGYCPNAVLYDEQPVRFRQSWRQRLRWAKGMLQVGARYGIDLMRGMCKASGFSCFDAGMTVLPAIILTLLGILLNGALTVFALRNGAPLLHALRGILNACFRGYLGLFALGALTTLTEWRRIRASAAQKILYTFTFPLFMATWLPISLAALVCRVEWKPIEHTRALQRATEKSGIFK